jgi:hypothetical protein
MNLKAALNTILEDDALPLSGDHGVVHGARALGTVFDWPV